MFLTFKNVGERFIAKNYSPVSLLSVTGKNLILLFGQLEKCELLPDFQYRSRSSNSIADLLRVASDRIAGFFIKFWATRAVALDISKAFVRV